MRWRVTSIRRELRDKRREATKEAFLLQLSDKVMLFMSLVFSPLGFSGFNLTSLFCIPVASKALYQDLQTKI